jgi:hypothetical protein
VSKEEIIAEIPEGELIVSSKVYNPPDSLFVLETNVPSSNPDIP